MSVRKAFLFLFLITLLAAPVLAAADSATVKGEVLDLACYIAHDSHGADHAKCAERCVQSGQPVGLLAEDGTVYMLFADHADDSAFKQTKSYAGKTVEVTGPVAEKAGLKAITVHSVKEL